MRVYARVVYVSETLLHKARGASEDKFAPNLFSEYHNHTHRRFSFINKRRPNIILAACCSYSQLARESWSLRIGQAAKAKQPRASFGLSSQCGRLASATMALARAELRGCRWTA